ncbi:hypothetical protein LshimejAT787_0900840 [Lyophyllum shimeji]|uniref:Uncharacterized protein n=1 Tax=Lyophyllum shimeji TaxID=47721 RepID=A0A9P3UMU7_LYOSH|nr:hypothetical protein LshimejAT787_0900840 [Lyophyllum shimeji]
MGKPKNIFRWNPRKKRSPAQQANAATLPFAKKTAESDENNKENDGKQGQGGHEEAYMKRFRNERKKCSPHTFRIGVASTQFIHSKLRWTGMNGRTFRRPITSLLGDMMMSWPRYDD